jgi:RNA polymerase sigma factor (sigma-70 family)
MASGWNDCAGASCNSWWQQKLWPTGFWAVVEPQLRARFGNERSFSTSTKKWTRRLIGDQYIAIEVHSPGERVGMAGAPSRQVSRHLSTLFQCGATGPIGDAELLERFVAGGDETAEAAFTALVERHGVMVLGVCRRVLGNRDEADDAFQATFLVLARKAAAIARREQLASWLHGVARHAALDARARMARQRAKERHLGGRLPEQPADQTLASEIRAVLDEELALLPERHRAAIVLCELEGLPRRQAASRLGISEGTLSSRLSRGKSRLRERLTRRGFALSAASVACVLGQDAQAVVLPPILIDSTIRTAALVASGSSLAGVVSTSVSTLTEGVLKTMLLAKLKFAFLAVLSLAVVSASIGVVAQDGPGQRTDNDRLKLVEQKLDRLLEVMGGQGRQTTQKPAAVSAHNRATLGGGTDSAPAPPPAAPLAPPPVPPPVAQRPDSPPPPPGHYLDQRVVNLERRFDEIERRFGELERWVIPAGNLSMRQSAAASGAGNSSSPGSSAVGEVVTPGRVVPSTVAPAVIDPTERDLVPPVPPQPGSSVPSAVTRSSD